MSFHSCPGGSGERPRVGKPAVVVGALMLLKANSDLLSTVRTKPHGIRLLRVAEKEDDGD